jgi:hypothetical protein
MVGEIEVKVRDSRSSLTLAVAYQLVDDCGAILNLVSANNKGSIRWTCHRTVLPHPAAIVKLATRIYRRDIGNQAPTASAYPKHRV